MKNITGLLITLSIVIIAGNATLAQKTNSFRKCATEEVNDSIFNANPEMKKSYLKTLEFVNQYVQANQGQSPKTTIYIPLVFHVVLSPLQHASFPDSRIQEQVDALNRDFAGLNPHSMGPFPNSLKVNTEIQFYLANVNPNSQPTTGIERRDYTGASWGTSSNVKFYASGGLNAWNPYEYLNFWVCDMGGGLCGYALYPSPAALSSGEFGLVTNYSVVGITGASAPYNNGSVSTHELAHCFFLKHIWGDQGGCLTDDDCNDTPLQDVECYGVPTGTLYDVCTSTGNGIMYMNFMDYVDDVAYSNFTPDQMTRMHACFAPGGPLQTLGSLTLPCTTNAGNDFTVCGLSATFMPVLNGTEVTVNWTCNNPAAVFSNPTIPNATVTVPAPGTYTFIWTISDQYGSLCSDSVLVTFLGNIPSAFTVTSSVCEGDMSIIAIDFPNNPNYSYQWSVSPAGIPAVLSGPGPHSVYWNSTGFVTVTLIVTDNVNGCVSQLTSHIIQVVPAGTPNCCIAPTPDAGADVNANCGLTYTLNGSVPAQGNTAVWTMLAGVGTATFANPNHNNTAVTVSSAGNYVFQWTETNGICDSSDMMTITFYEQPVAHITEETLWVCGYQAELIAVQSIPNSALLWSVIPPSSGTFSPNNNSDSVIVTAGAGYGTYYIVLNENNFYCSSWDTVEVHFLDTIIPDAGPDQSVCGSYVLLNATNAGQGYWHSVLNAWYDASVWPNDTVFCSSCRYNHSVVAYYSSENDTVTFYWIETGNCGSGYDSVNVYFGSYPYPPLNPYSSDTMVCGTTLTTLQIPQPYYGTGYWYDTDPQTQFYPDNSSLHPDSVVISGNAYGMHSFYYVLENGCIVTSNAVQVLFGGTGVVHGTISGLGGYTDFTAAVYESGSPIVKGSGTPDAAGLYSVSAPAGTYYLKVNVDDPVAHTGMATTYYGNTWKWADALTINVPACDTTTANITMYTFPLATGGNCRAYGTVMYDMGGPVEGANVYLLYKPVNTPAILELTDASGYYSLNNIPNGNYKIQVDIPGLPQVTTHHITVNPFDTLFPDVNFIVDTINISKEYGWGIYADSNLVYGIGEPLSVQKPVKVFPVPFSNELFLESYSDSNMIIEWYSQNGEMLSVEEMHVNTGNNHMAIPAGLSKGVYYIKVTAGNTVYVKKVVRE